jgi:hypothetical protein
MMPHGFTVGARRVMAQTIPREKYDEGIYTNLCKVQCDTELKGCSMWYAVARPVSNVSIIFCPTFHVLFTIGLFITVICLYIHSRTR